MRPVKAYDGAPMMLADPRAAELDMVIIRECTELFYTAAVHNDPKTNADEARDLAYYRSVSERLIDLRSGWHRAQGKVWSWPSELC